MKWDDVIGQQKAKARLKGLVASGKMPHALMLCGDTGCGSLSLAMALASRLLCQNAGDADDACGTCPQCMMLRQWHHPDLYFSYPTIKAKSMSSEHKPVSDDYSAEWNELICQNGGYITLEMWMQAMKATTQQAIITAAESDEIARKLSLKSSQGGYKVCIIWLAERMNEESANKILKTLEEPPQQTVFILVVEHPERLLDTIRSRVQRIDVPSIGLDELAKALVEKRGIDEDTARKLSRASGGNWLGAVEQLLPDSEQKMFLELFISLMRSVYQRDVRAMKQWSDTVGDSKFGREKQKRLLAYFMRMVRESFMSNFHTPELNYMTQEEEQFVSKFGRFINEANVIEINELLELALRDISQNTSQKVVFFDTVLRLTVLIQRK